MRRLWDEFLEFIHWLEFLVLFVAFLVFLAFIFDLAGLDEVRRVAAQPWKDLLLYVLAALSLVGSLHFLLLILRARRLRRMIRQDSQGGPVLVSPRALKRLIQEVLGETELEGARARLSPGRKGLNITVELRRAGPGLVETARQIQRLLRQRVEFEAGIGVNRVEVHARSLRREREKGEAAEPIEPATSEQAPEESESGSL